MSPPDYARTFTDSAGSTDTGTKLAVTETITDTAGASDVVIGGKPVSRVLAETWTPNANVTALQRRGRPDRTLPFLGRPAAANTGLNVLGLSTADLTVINGDLILDNAWRAANGAVGNRLYVRGHLVMTATTGPITIQNSLIEGRTFSGTPPYEAIVRARRGDAPTSAVLNLTNCRVTCVQPDVGIVSITGERLGAIERCHIDLGSDLVDYWIPSIPKIKGCLLERYSFWANDPKHTNDSAHPGWSHNDGIQHDGGSDGGYIIGNTIDMRAADGVGDVAVLTASFAPDRNWGGNILMTPGHGNITNLKIQGNYLMYGEVHIGMPTQGGGFDSGNSWDVSGNFHNDRAHGYVAGSLWSHQYVRWGYPMGMPTSSVHDNYFMDDSNVSVTALRATALPTPTLIGGATASGQYISFVNNSTVR